MQNGYSGKRYYGGCQYIDMIESKAIEDVCKLFDCNYANVQPHCGSSANQAVYRALLKYGDTVLGMDLGAGRSPHPPVIKCHFQDKITE